MRLKVSSAKRRPFCLGLNVLKVGFQEWLMATSVTGLIYLNSLESQPVKCLARGYRSVYFK